jgi:hypothetical protein
MLVGLHALLLQLGASRWVILTLCGGILACPSLFLPALTERDGVGLDLPCAEMVDSK